MSVEEVEIDRSKLRFSMEDIRAVIGEKNRFLYIYAKTTPMTVCDLLTEKIIKRRIIKKRWIVLDVWRPYLSAHGKSKKCAKANLIRKYGK